MGGSFTNEQMHLMLLDIKDRLSLQGVTFSLGSDMLCGENGSFETPDGMVSSVGIEDLYTNPKYKKLSMTDVVGFVFPAFHELYGHASQVVHEFNKDTALSRFLALNHYACAGSSVYYGVSLDGNISDSGYKQYLNQPCEIAADYAGLKGTFNYFSKYYGKNVANNLLCDYIDHRVADGTICSGIPRGLKSVSDILKSYDTAFKQQLIAHKDLVFDESFNKPDIVVSSDYGALNGGYATVINNCKIGFVQDYMIAALCFASNDDKLNHDLHIEYMHDRSVFENMDMSLDSNILNSISKSSDKKFIRPVKRDLKSVSLTQLESNKFDIFSKPNNSDDYQPGS